MANPTYTAEEAPTGDRGGPGTTWFKPSTHQFFVWSGGGWVISQDGLNAVEVDDLTITTSVTSDGDEGITGNYSNPTRISVKNGIVTRIDVA